MNGRLRKGSTCPACAKAKLVPIAYGFPMGKTVQDSELGILSIGGCVVTGNDPELECRGCKEKFMRNGEWVLINER